MTVSNNKKIISASLLISGLLPWIFVLGVYVQEQRIRHFMKEKLEESLPLNTITLADHLVHWVKKDREILVNGKMFDIKSTTSVNGFTTFTGLYDEQETQLKKLAEKGWKKHRSQGHQLLTQLISAFQNLYYSLDESSAITLPGKRDYPITHSHPLVCIPQDIPSPPPWC
jgi:hypothetical protein